MDPPWEGGSKLATTCWCDRPGRSWSRSLRMVSCPRGSKSDLTWTSSRRHAVPIAEHELHTVQFLPLVKAYPALSRKYGEVCCIAGVEITPRGPKWVRLYPVSFRTLR